MEGTEEPRLSVRVINAVSSQLGTHFTPRLTPFVTAIHFHFISQTPDKYL